MSEGAGCYGHNGADDAAMDAAVLALAMPGRPVQVVWSRADELAWAPLGTAGVVRIAADTAADGGVLSWRHEIWSGSFISRPGMAPTTGVPRYEPPRPAMRRSTRTPNHRSNAAAVPDAMPFPDTTFRHMRSSII